MKGCHRKRCFSWSCFFRKDLPNEQKADVPGVPWEKSAWKLASSGIPRWVISWQPQHINFSVEWIILTKSQRVRFGLSINIKNLQDAEKNIQLQLIWLFWQWVHVIVCTKFRLHRIFCCLWDIKAVLSVRGERKSFYLYKHQMQIRIFTYRYIQYTVYAWRMNIMLKIGSEKLCKINESVAKSRVTCIHAVHRLYATAQSLFVVVKCSLSDISL